MALLIASQFVLYVIVNKEKSIKREVILWKIGLPNYWTTDSLNINQLLAAGTSR